MEPRGGVGMKGVAERSYEKIKKTDLGRLESLALEDRNKFFTRNPALARLYHARVLCVALCQGAALHFLDGKNGVKDFDVWTFFAAHPARKFPSRRPVMRADFGPSRFGRHPADVGYTGRRVDFLMRAIQCPLRADPAEALQRYLSESRTSSARCLAEKAVVLIGPAGLRGSVIWPLVNR
jgi:hypothetical protein